MNILPDKNRLKKLSVTQNDIGGGVLFCPECDFEAMSAGMKPFCPNCGERLNLIRVDEELVELVCANAKQGG